MTKSTDDVICILMSRTRLFQHKTFFVLLIYFAPSLKFDVICFYHFHFIVFICFSNCFIQLNNNSRRTWIRYLQSKLGKNFLKFFNSIKKNLFKFNFFWNFFFIYSTTSSTIIITITLKRNNLNNKKKFIRYKNKK